MTEGRRYRLERVDEAAVVQIYADGFPALTLRDRTLLWHLYLAAIAGRDIYYDQRYAHSLAMRDLVEGIVTHGDELEPSVREEILRYTKLFWINSGPYNTLTARKFVLRLTRDELLSAARTAASRGARFVVSANETLDEVVDRLAPMFFDPEVDPILTCKTPDAGRDMLDASANNLYAGVRIAELASFEERHPLNSRLVRSIDADGTVRLVEEVYRIGGRYDREIRRVVGHLRDAIPFATAGTAEALRALVRFYETGDDADRVAYDIAWVRDQTSTVDTINGFIEVYLDPRGTKGAWEAVVCHVNQAKTRQIETIAAHAQWFEDHMPWEPRFRKAQVQGVTARAIDVVIETGDAGPLTPLGINLPNDQAVREQYGSKSVSLSNVAEAYERAMLPGMRQEFAWSDEEVARAERHAAFAQELTTELHEVIGHGSGQMSDGAGGAPHQLLREHYSTLEEARADLVALYFLADPALAEFGLVPADVHEAIVRAEYEQYTRTALLQLRRVRVGTQLEEDHMRNRQLVVHWLMAHTTAIERRVRSGRTYYVMTDASAFRAGAGRLLAEVQRIKGDGDYDAGRDLVETYGVRFDPALRDEVVARTDALQLPSYTGFVMPRLEARTDASGAVVDVEISYPCDLTAQMLEYSAMSRA